MVLQAKNESVTDCKFIGTLPETIQSYPNPLQNQTNNTEELQASRLAMVGNRMLHPAGLFLPGSTYGDDNPLLNLLPTGTLLLFFQQEPMASIVPAVSEMTAFQKRVSGVIWMTG